MASHVSHHIPARVNIPLFMGMASIPSWGVEGVGAGRELGVGSSGAAAAAGLDGERLLT